MEDPATADPKRRLQVIDLSKEEPGPDAQIQIQIRKESRAKARREIPEVISVAAAGIGLISGIVPLVQMVGSVKLQILAYVGAGTMVLSAFAWTFRAWKAIARSPSITLQDIADPQLRGLMEDLAVGQRLFDQMLSAVKRGGE